MLSWQKFFCSKVTKGNETKRNCSVRMLFSKRILSFERDIETFIHNYIIHIALTRPSGPKYGPYRKLSPGTYVCRLLYHGGGGSPRSNAYLWANPKVPVFKNGQFRGLLFLRKIFFFEKPKEHFHPVKNDNFFLYFLKKYFFHFFRKFFLWTLFFFSDTFFELNFFGKQTNCLCP